MATLTQCLTAALVPRYSGGAGAVPVHAAMARAVLSVLVGAAQGGASPLRSGGAHGRGVVAALMAALPMVRAEGAGLAGAQVPGMAAFSPGMSFPAVQPLEQVGKSQPALSGFLQKLWQDRPVSPALWQMPQQFVAPDGAVQVMAARQDGALPGMAFTGTAPQGAGVLRSAALLAPSEPVFVQSFATHQSSCLVPDAGGGRSMCAIAGGYGQKVYVPAGHGVAMLLGHMAATQAQKNAAFGAVHRMCGVYDTMRAMPHHAGLMADVLHHAGVSGGLEGAAQGALPPVPDYLHAISRAVGVASMVLPSTASAPAVQAQITVNAPNSTPQAIGNEVAHRMSTLRMQARQANMGQF
ncbi:MULTISPECIES: hypothetical protein [Acetobacter]|uniref:Uncharacterized protein n=3 Tax=Acetobacter TaxID=434 RepID=A0A841QI95_9PROT|nr:hypothetical protein [Acetobacter lovaniensis]MBB6457954.1 hypothetical protein [Acetobacter lovaniensis]MCI1697815.1 hypothetical protein [Acetobacter lovaniensis]MCI1795840.1 hypothetical protein [Acetobacter lovaniensis]MCP1239423.1 hypothetical protein [Acetobacter lovaniensis]NHN82208.1 hypothetical protein [Acetobacter lovaniensis]